MSGLSPEMTETTQRFWEKRTGEPVSEEDARETIRNVVGFFDLLDQWDRDVEHEEEHTTP